MKRVVSLNRTGRDQGSPGDNGQWMDPQIDADEYPGYALCLVKGQLMMLADVHSDEFQSLYKGKELILLLYQVVDPRSSNLNSPRDCRVEMMGHIAQMSQLFKLSSGRTGFSVRLWRVCYPGQGAIDIASTQRGEWREQIINVVSEDIPDSGEVVSLMRPAYDVTVDGAFATGGLTTKWRVDALLSDATARAIGQLSWISVSSDSTESVIQVNAILRFAQGGASAGAEAWDPEMMACYITEDGKKPGAKISVSSLATPLGVIAASGVLCWPCGIVTAYSGEGSKAIDVMPGVVRSDSNTVVDEESFCFIQVGPVER